jgi:hypothetical protein
VKLGKNVSFVAVRIIDLLDALNIKLESVVATTPSQKYNMNMTKIDWHDNNFKTKINSS